jgi:ankyrin repeat protein
MEQGMARQSMKHVIQMFIDGGRLPTALSEAARWGESDMVRQLLEQGIAVDSRDEEGGTALMNAASAGEMQIMRLLLKRGADVNAVQENKGYTPLIWGLAALHSERKYLAIVSTLLATGADVTIRTRDGRTAIDFAKERGSEELLKLLESAKDRRFP